MSWKLRILLLEKDCSEAFLPAISFLVLREYQTRSTDDTASPEKRTKQMTLAAGLCSKSAV